MRKVLAAILLVSLICAGLTACGKAQDNVKATEAATQAATQAPTQAATAAVNPSQPTEPAAASSTQAPTAAPAETPSQHGAQQEQAQPDAQPPQEEAAPAPEQEPTLQMTIGNTPVSVAWEDNESVNALKELCRNQPLTIGMSMYGGFEQVGAIGTALPQNDVQITTASGDIVLYAGDQLVVFYGANTWAYTRLGHITDQGEDGMTQLLSNGDTTITIRLAA